MSFDSSCLLFIVGHYKSGSTWLLNMLSLHPDIRGIQETHLFHHLRYQSTVRDCTRALFTSVPWSGGGLRQLPRHYLVKRFGRFVVKGRPLLSFPVEDRPLTRLDLPLRDQLILRNRLVSSPSSQEYSWRFFEFLWSHLQSKRYILEKTPNNLRYISDIIRIFPQARLVAIYRDGRDVVASDRSFKKHYKRAADWSFRASIVRWRDEVDAQLRASENADLYTLSYESLIQDSGKTLRQLLNRLGLNTRSDTLCDMIERSSFRFRSGRQQGQEDPHSFFRKGIVGDWRNCFESNEVRQFKEIANHQLIRLGYESTYDW
jgi:hypothetical protein